VDEGKYLGNGNARVLLSASSEQLFHEAQFHWRNQSLQVGSQRIALLENSHLIPGILAFMNESMFVPNSPQEWQMILNEYEKALNVFIESDRDTSFQAVFFLQAEGGEDPENAFKNARHLKEIYETRHGLMFDYSSVSGEKRDEIKSPDDFVANVRHYAQTHPKEKILVSINLHGSEDGAGIFSK
jgi:hypothetical protein